MRSKQKTLHSTSAIFAAAALSGAVWISCIALSASLHATRSFAQTSGDQVARLRLIAAPGPTNGRYRAAVEIAMQPGSHTYWKQPGDAGVPPVFSFNGSTNVARADVSFPTPKRIDEQGIQAFGYDDGVVFPVDVEPSDPAKPAVLRADVTYAVCRKICIPAHGTATITLAPGGHGVDAAKVTAALAEVPAPASSAERRELTIVPAKGAPRPSWTLSWTGASPVTDMFADAPEGFYFETKKLAPNRFMLTATQVVSASKSTSVPVALTLARAGHSLVVKETLDVTGSTN